MAVPDPSLRGARPVLMLDPATGTFFAVEPATNGAGPLPASSMRTVGEEEPAIPTWALVAGGLAIVGAAWYLFAR